MERDWTPAQRAAIDTRDRTLLVSAAAGSGKTATLTQRIINSILDEDNSKDISKMLIATFTNAAVAELRERISAAIRESAKQNPGNARLEEQLLRVKDAKIVTINSFCNDVLRSCAERVGLTPTYRIAEPAEAALIARDLLDGLINAAFSGELDEVCTAEEFARVAEGLTSIRGERELVDVFSYIYDKLSSEEKGIETLGTLIEKYKLPEGGISKTSHFAFIKGELTELLLYAKGTLERLRRELEAQGGSDGTVGTLNQDISIICSLAECETYGELNCAFASLKFPKIVSSKSLMYEQIKETRNKIKKAINDYGEKYFSLPEDNFADLYPIIYKNGLIIYKFLKKFDEVFLADKKRRGIVEFRDAERYACEALLDADGNPTDIARAIAEKYTDIYIDEYQDVNALQGRIFEAITRGDNCFMVGDIKQSIYGFRSAKPDFFRNKKLAYPKLSSSEYSPRASLFMSSNFRCDEPIIDYVNSVFDTLFGELGESIGYEPSDRLCFAKKYERGEMPTGHIPELHLVEKPMANADVPEEDARDSNAADVTGNEEAASEGESIEAELISAQERSAELVADKIAELVGKERLASGKLIAPGDIAIIMRSVKNVEALYANAVERRGIPCEIAGNTDFFLNEEVLLALSLLNSIDNPKKDVYLAATMVSPLFGFTFDELLLIRRGRTDVPLYDSLVGYVSENPAFEKGARLIAELKKYRRLAEGMSVDSFISLLYRETGLLSLASVNGGRDNLVLLHGYARAYEKSSFKGLYSFISYVNGIIESGGEFKTSESGESAERSKVQIITSHSSKGLEFPVVFVAEAAKAVKVSPMNAAAAVALSADFGFSVGVRDESGLATLKDPSEAIIRKYIEKKEYEEALRVLYVTLTRARERLYVYGSVDDVDKKISECNEKRENHCRYTLSNLHSTLDMLLVCGKGARLVKHYRNEQSSVAIDTSNAIDGNRTLSDSRVLTELRDELLSRFGYQYHTPDKLGIPEKLSVSALSPTVLDGNEAEAAQDTVIDLDKILDGNLCRADDTPPIIPNFLGGKDGDEAAKRGTATHTFMQFFDVESLAANGAEAELARLVNIGFISREDAERVRLDEITRFASSPLFEEMRSARKLYRELRFNVMLPASEFTEDEQRKKQLGDSTLLVQGVIDCIIEDGNGTLHLVDYKTDRLSRAELKDEALAKAKLLDRHALQLKYYKSAITKMFGKAPATVGIFSLALGKEIVAEQL